MTQASLGTTENTTNIMKLVRARTKVETKEFLDEFAKHIKIVLDSLEGEQRVFYQISSDMVSHEVVVKFGSILSLNDLPPEVQAMISESEKKLRAKEDGDGKTVITRTDKIDSKHFEQILKQKGERECPEA